MTITKEMLVGAVPANKAKSISSAVVAHVNDVINDPDTRKAFQENLITYNSILQEGKYKVTDYISAIMYTSFKIMGKSNIDAYAATFPDRMKRYAKERKSMEEIHNFVSGYNRTKLVVTLAKKARIPAWLLNMDIHQEAINTNAHLMRHSKNELVRQKAATDLMNYLTPPEDAAIKVDIGIETTFLDSMKTAMRDLAKEQQGQIAAGNRSPAQVAATRIIDAEVVEVK